MQKDTPKKLPRTDVIDRQKEHTRKVLELDQEALKRVRGGSARYGLPPPDDDIS